MQNVKELENRIKVLEMELQELKKVKARTKSDSIKPNDNSVKSNILGADGVLVVEDMEFSVCEAIRAVITSLVKDGEYKNVDPLVFNEISSDNNFLESIWKNIDDSEREIIFNKLELNDDEELNFNTSVFSNIYGVAGRISTILREKYNYEYIGEGIWINKVELAYSIIQCYNDNVDNKKVLPYKKCLNQTDIDKLYNTLIDKIEESSSNYEDPLGKLFDDFYYILCLNSHEMVKEEVLGYIKFVIENVF
jgi:hypothetical protein